MVVEHCPHTKECFFYQAATRFCQSGPASHLVHEYLKVYCCGQLHENCYRFCYLRAKGTQPPDNLTPTGLALNNWPPSQAQTAAESTPGC